MPHPGAISLMACPLHLRHHAGSTVDGPIGKSGTRRIHARQTDSRMAFALRLYSS